MGPPHFVVLRYGGTLIIVIGDEFKHRSLIVCRVRPVDCDIKIMETVLTVILTKCVSEEIHTMRFCFRGGSITGLVRSAVDLHPDFISVVRVIEYTQRDIPLNCFLFML